jgi:hypothetical protein
VYQLVDTVRRGGKGGDETDDTWLPTAVVKAVTLVQKSVDDLLGQAAEEDVRLAAFAASRPFDNAAKCLPVFFDWSRP